MGAIGRSSRCNLRALSKSVELSDEEVALMLEALQEAAFYRDTRSRVLKSAVARVQGRAFRRTATGGSEGGGPDEHRQKAGAYESLLRKLKGET